MRFLKNIVIFVFLVFAACASTESPVEEHNYNIVLEDVEEEIFQDIDVPRVIEVVEYEMPDDAVPRDTAESSVNIVHTRTKDFTVLPKKETFSGGAVVYNYVENHIYQIFLAPRQLTHLILEEGEKMTAPPAAGDTLNFMLATSIQTKGVLGAQVTEHILLKAINPGNETNLVITTNKRIYHFKLCAFERTYMPIVYFQYPMSSIEEFKEKEEAKNAKNIIINSDVRDLDFSYDIIPHDIHMPRWAPSMVFNDGVKTYINFPSAKRAAENPALFLIENNKDRILVNYRVTGDYYIVDQVINHAELIVDINAGNVITIKRTSSGE